MSPWGFLYLNLNIHPAKSLPEYKLKHLSSEYLNNKPEIMYLKLEGRLANIKFICLLTK